MTRTTPFPEPAWWEDEPMRAALAARDIGAVYRLLIARGMSQRAIATHTRTAQSEVSEIINGRRVHLYDVLARIADGLGIPRGYMGLAASAPPPVTTAPRPEPESRRAFLDAAMAAISPTPADSEPPRPRPLDYVPDVPSRVTSRDLDGLEHMLMALRDVDQSSGGAAVQAAADAVAAKLTAALRVAGDDATRRQLLVLLTRATQQAAWAALDTGNWPCCRDRMATALTAARESEDRALLAHTLYGAARALLHNTHAADALRLLQLAELHATGPRQRALLAANQAWAMSYLDSDELTRRRLHQAHSAFERANEGPSWLSWFDTADFRAVTGAAWTQLGEHETALHDIEIALAHRGESEVRPSVFENISMARCQLALGATDETLHTGQRILTVAAELRSTRVRDRMIPLVQDTATAPASEIRDLGAALARLG